MTKIGVSEIIANIICEWSLGGASVRGEVVCAEEEGGLGRVDGEGDEVAQEADDVPLVPQAGHDSGGIF